MEKLTFASYVDKKSVEQVNQYLSSGWKIKEIIPLRTGNYPCVCVILTDENAPVDFQKQ